MKRRAGLDFRPSLILPKAYPLDVSDSFELDSHLLLPYSCPLLLLLLSPTVYAAKLPHLLFDHSLSSPTTPFSLILLFLLRNNTFISFLLSYWSWMCFSAMLFSPRFIHRFKRRLGIERRASSWTLSSALKSAMFEHIRRVGDPTS